jgi:hypothetical protein
MWKVVWKSSGRPVTLFLTMKAFDADQRTLSEPLRDMAANDWKIVWAEV